MGIIIKKYSGISKNQFKEIMNELGIIREQLTIHNLKLNTIMSTFEELSAKLDAQTAVITDVKTSLDAVDLDIAGLKTQISNLPPAGSVITQEQLDSLSAKADAVSQGLADLRSKAAAIDAETPETTPPATGG